MPNFLTRWARIFFRSKRRGLATLSTAAVVCLAIAAGLVYRHLVTGGMAATQKPSTFETFIARRLVNLSIPEDANRLRNPLNADLDRAAIAAGRDLYKKNCEVCHAYDGSGHTAPGANLYPPAANLRGSDLARRTDGALFHLIRYGIRNTGMPGWQLPDEQIWQLVIYIRNLPPTSAIFSVVPPQLSSVAGSHYVGSAACSACHAQLYDRWKKTRMANVVRDPREHLDAVIPDLSKPDPLVKFTVDDIALVYGSKWKQRYFKKIGDDFYPLPAQWDITHQIWRGYFVKEDWWVPYYPPDNFKRPTSTTCDGCHSVNYNTRTHTVTEWNVGCEKCHGAGSEHVARPTNFNIINPARLDFVQANDTCIQCHSQGRPIENPIDGKYYDWPVGFHMGMKLSDFWKLEEHKVGQTSFTHFADGTAHKNRMQGNDFVTSLMYTHGVTCASCHDSHGSDNDGMLRKPANALCLDCHGPASPNGPRAPTLEGHTHHKVGSAGSECIACHMPKIEQTIGDVNVRTHDFHFVTPAKTDALKVPNACNVCHADRSSAWTSDALMKWSDRSPWRTAN